MAFPWVSGAFRSRWRSGPGLALRRAPSWAGIVALTAPVLQGGRPGVASLVNSGESLTEAAGSPGARGCGAGWI